MLGAMSNLEVKEGIIVDAEGKPIHVPFSQSDRDPQGGPTMRTVQFGGTWAPLLFFPIVAIFLTFGLTLIAAFGIAFIIGWILLSAKRILFPR
jgi:hypothetical protein